MPKTASRADREHKKYRLRRPVGYLKNRGQSTDAPGSEGVFSSLSRFFRKSFKALKPALSRKGEKGAPRRSRAVRWCAALALTAVLLFVCSFFTVRTLAVPVVIRAEVNGRVFGVESNTAVESAIRELEETVGDILERRFSFPYEVHYSFAREPGVKVADSEEISRILYACLPETVCTGAGLYVDGNLVAVCETEQVIRDELDRITSDRVGLGEGTGIYNEIDVVTRAYAAGSMTDAAALRDLLETLTVPLDQRDGSAVRQEDPASTELGEISEPDDGILQCDLEIHKIRPKKTFSSRLADTSGIYLAFYSTEILRYQEEVPFATEYVETDLLYTSMEKITTAGVNGRTNVEARAYYVDGAEVRREILSEKVVEEPVTQVVSKGTLVLPEDLGVTGAAGRFILPHISYISSPYGERDDGFHRGWDLPGPVGESIYAAASGTVVAAIGQDGGFTYTPGMDYSTYGYCVVIEHDNGYFTLYGHCSKICVTLGQQVKQGEKIAEIGETGVAYGPHVHFEIRQGYTRFNPGDGFMYKGNVTVNDFKNNGDASN